jgi:predicted branched-subunit amino acid permease
MADPTPMPDQSAQSQPSRKQLRDFGLLIAVAFPLLLGWLLPSLHGAPFRSWTLVIAIPALLLGVLAPRSLAAPYHGWMALGHGLGWINSHLILGLVFVLVLQPIALIMRSLGHDPLRKRRHQGNSYRELRDNPTINLRRIF